MASFESDELADDWETHSMFHRSARSLPLNSVDDLLNLQELLLKLCQNIIDNPIEIKFHSIKLSNKSIQNRLINRKGGIEFLAAIGFISITKDGEKYLSLYENNGGNVDNTINIKKIEDGVIWLNETVETCLLMSNITANSKNLAQSKNVITPCAECIIQIRLSTGQSVIGGFMREDKVIDVLSFAQTFFKADRANEVVLRHTHNSTEINSFDVTLDKASLFPRAILIATTQSKEIRITKVQQTNTDVKINLKKKAEIADKIRNDKIVAREAETRHKERILSSFKDDRTDFKDRGKVGGVQKDDEVVQEEK